MSAYIYDFLNSSIKRFKFQGQNSHSSLPNKNKTKDKFFLNICIGRHYTSLENKGLQKWRKTNVLKKVVWRMDAFYLLLFNYLVSCCKVMIFRKGDCDVMISEASLFRRVRHCDRHWRVSLARRWHPTLRR